jgi:hypothetical protein
MVDNKFCPASAGKMLLMLKNKRTLTLLKVECAVEVVIGLRIKTVGRLMEADGFVQITAYASLLELQLLLVNPLTAELLAKLTKRSLT